MRNVINFINCDESEIIHNAENHPAHSSVNIDTNQSTKILTEILAEKYGNDSSPKLLMVCNFIHNN